MDQDLENKTNAIINNFLNRSRDIQYVTDRIKSMTPVPPKTVGRRVIQQGPKGGLFYVSAGKKVYLTPGQCRRCETGNYADGGCPPSPPRRGQCQASRVSLKRKIRKLQRSRRSLRRRLPRI